MFDVATKAGADAEKAIVEHTLRQAPLAKIEAEFKEQAGDVAKVMSDLGESAEACDHSSPAGRNGKSTKKRKTASSSSPSSRRVTKSLLFPGWFRFASDWR